MCPQPWFQGCFSARSGVSPMAWNSSWMQGFPWRLGSVLGIRPPAESRRAGQR